ncbi:transcriptional regulator, ArsR family [Coriobacterium glomerans PW2]|uniref:Transcriptional regulator, ArsR family n=1 Tax=Coriobacterium glomerans (strain ATCC 49209 / DSM 20642 / JCM 10262 / PW2) TaxID=700015 RepID=F2N8S9_CORGP|nr:autorepressor SdpR family transcription factor [Coriobacterium glomerans]AEB07462.1 transcriptional regulator, ArsR family [Coriobacterium glomerans PW2]
MSKEGFKALADPTRRRMLELLRDGSMTAGEIAAHFDMTKPSISHHLGKLKAAGLIEDERRGQQIIYTLNMTVMQSLMRWFYSFSDATDSEGSHDPRS